MVQSAEIVDFPQPGRLPDPSLAMQDPRNQQRREDQPKDDHDQLYKKLKGWYREGQDAHKDWFDEQKQDFEFAAGWQWDDDDLSLLRDAQRPAVTFDRIGRNINAVCGMEVNSRNRAVAYPREVGDIELSEIPTAALSYVTDETEADETSSASFRDMLIAGMGWTVTEMNFLDYENGLPDQLRVPVGQMNWDPHARKGNLSDRRWHSRTMTMPIEEARRVTDYEFDDTLLHAGWAEIIDAEIDRYDRSGEAYENENNAEKGAPKTRRRVTLIEFQWRDIEDYFQLRDLRTGEDIETSVSKGKMLAAKRPDIFEGVPRQRYVYWSAILGRTVLKKRRLDAQKGLTYECMTGFWDEAKKQWYGLVRAMKDPQRVANSLYSHSLSMFKHGAKSGFIFEESAVEDVVAFERNQARVGANLEVNDGAISGNKIQPITPSPLPTHSHELLNVSLSQIQEGVGIPIEMVATATGKGPAQTALLESERRKAGMNLLAPFFSSKRLHLKRQSKLVLRYVMEFMNDGRLMRMVDEGQTRFVPLFLENADISRYDIVVDESPSSPDVRERSWQTIQQVLPIMERMQAPPELFIEAARHIPDLPATFLSKLAKAVEESQEPSPEKQRQAELAARAQEAEVSKEEGQAAKDHTAADLNKAKVKEIAGDMALKASEQMRETVLAKDTPPGGVNYTEFA